MRVRGALALLLVLCLSLCACGGGEKDGWQEQYDLGVRYLSEGNYEQAAVAFTAAIEIDPKREEAYIGLARACTAQGDTQRAAEALAQAEEACGPSEALTQAARELGLPEAEPSGAGQDSSAQQSSAARTERIERESGGYMLVDYDDSGRWIHGTGYSDSDAVTDEMTWAWDSRGRAIEISQSVPAHQQVITYRFSYPQSGSAATVTLDWQRGDHSGSVELEYPMTDPANYLFSSVIGFDGSGLFELELRERDSSGGTVSRMKYDGQGNPLPPDA